MKIGFFLHEGVEVMDFAGPMEVLSCSGFEISIVAKNLEPVTTQSGMKVLPDYSIKDHPSFPIWLFFGGNSDLPFGDEEVIAWVKTVAIKALHILSVCTGARILAKAGLLDGLIVTTFHDEIERLKQQFPELDVRTGVRFVDNGKIITTAGVSAGIDGALHLVKKLKGRTAMEHAIRYMEYEGWNEQTGLVVSHEI
jgi:transcriptional regulator GlxA family with amidase domain